VRDASVLEDLQKLEHGSVLEWNVVVGPIGREVLLHALSVGLKSVVVLLQGDVSLHIFIKNEGKPGNLSSAQFELKVLQHALEPLDGHGPGHFHITNSEEGFRSEASLLQALFQLL